jgi:hypothetical protein
MFVGENMQWLASLRHLPSSFIIVNTTDGIKYFDHGIKIRTVHGL